MASTAEPVHSIDYKAVVQVLHTFGHRFSVDTEDVRACAIKSTIMSLAYANRRVVFGALYNPTEHYIDWDLLERNPAASCVLGDVGFWISVTELFSWRPRALAGTDLAYPLLFHLRGALCASGLLECKDSDPAWLNVPCRLLLLQTLRGVDGLLALERSTCRWLQRNTRTQCYQVVAMLSNHKFPPEEYERTFIAMLAECEVETGELSRHAQFLSRQTENLRQSLALKSIQSFQGRPRLRERMARIENQNVDVWDTFTGFCYHHRFPNSFSDRIKRQLYFLAAQTRWPWQPHVAAFVPTKDELHSNLQAKQVQNPEQHIIGGVIDSLCMDGLPPFEALLEFKRSCFDSFPLSEVNKMNMTQFLRLYACAYQNQKLWKPLWSATCGILSVQIIKSVEAFVARVPFADEAFIRLLTRARTLLARPRPELTSASLRTEPGPRPGPTSVSSTTESAMAGPRPASASLRPERAASSGPAPETATAIATAQEPPASDEARRETER